MLAKQRQDADYDQSCEIIRYALVNAFKTRKKGYEDSQQDYAADKAEFLGVNCEYRVVSRFRQIAIGLHAAAQSQADHAARSDGNQRLAGLIAGTLAIGVRMQEGLQAGPAVRCHRDQ